MRIAQMRAGLLGLHGPSLKKKNAGDDLQTVGNTVLHLLEQRLLLLQQFGRYPLRSAPLGDVLDRQESELLSISLVEHLACVQQHRASPDHGKVPLDFISLHRGMPGPDIFQKQSKLGDIPLSIAQPVNRPAVNVLTVQLERLIESAVGGDDAQAPVEDKQRIAERVHNRLRERARVVEVSDRLAVGERPDRCRRGRSG